MASLVTRFRGLSLLLALWAMSSLGCSGPHKDKPLKPALEVVRRLLEPDWEAVFAVHYCAVGDEIRPAQGCIGWQTLGSESGVTANGAPLQRRYSIPTTFVGKDLVIERLYRPATQGPWGEWSHLAPMVKRQVASEVELSFALPDGEDKAPVDVQASSRLMLPQEETRETGELVIGQGAILTGGIGVDPSSVGAAPVEFRLVARGDGGDRVLLERLVDPADPAGRTWSDYRLDLAPLAGARVRLVFSTRAVRRPGQTADETFAVPLWSEAKLLEPPPTTGPTRLAKRNLLLISIDTLRADCVGTYGSELPTTPHLDRFAEEGTVFEDAVTPYSSTTAAHMSMLTGVYPSIHGVWGPTHNLPRQIPTLAQTLAGHGFQTAAVTEDGMLAAMAGFVSGFTYYREFKEANPANTTGFVGAGVTSALEWLAAHPNERFFLFFHTYQVHGPFTPPPSFDRFKTYRDDEKEVPLDDKTPGHIRQRLAYAGEILYTDSEVRRLLDGLAGLGEADRTIVVITADHGEAFAEHRMSGHGWNLYEEVLHVPFIVHAPGLVPAKLRVPTTVSLVDLTPTVLDLLGVPIPPTVQGASLVPLLTDPKAPSFASRPVFAELKLPRGSHHTAARLGGMKWIKDTASAQGIEIYDLRADPRELRNLAATELVAQGEELVAQYAAQNSGALARLGNPRSAPVVLDDGTQRKLKALGYVVE